MELPAQYLPGAISLLDQLDKRLMVMLRDGKTLIGDLRTIDQFANLVLGNTLERIYVNKCYGDIPRGMFMIRGENVVLAGELTDENPPELQKVRLFASCLNAVCGQHVCFRSHWKRFSECSESGASSGSNASSHERQ